MTTAVRCGNTTAYFVRGKDGGLLVDTGYAGMLAAFDKALKQNGVGATEIKYVLATHYHPDHAGLIGDLMKRGVRLLLIDVQAVSVHFPDGIFTKDKLPFTPIDERAAAVISCGESRAFLSRLGISGEIFPAPSHSADSISLALDDGDCLVGDLEPLEYREAYEEDAPMRRDWERVLSHRPKRILYAHAPAKIMDGTLAFLTLREKPKLKEAAADWFSARWKVPREAYLACMNGYLDRETEYGWYLCLDGGRIVGGLGVVENDFHDRPDLRPNVCAVYTEKKYRGRGIAGTLLNIAVEDMRARGIAPLYLVTDHTGFYERYGWEFLCMVRCTGEKGTSRMYIHR